MTRRNAPWRDVREIEGPDGIVATLYLGDCVEVMAALESESIHAVVTDPPYELGFMGKAWDKAGGVATTVTTWERVRALLKPGGHLTAFAGSRTYHRIASAIENADFEIRDQLMWIYGSGFPKSHDISKCIDKRGGYGAVARHAPSLTMRSGPSANSTNAQTRAARFRRTRRPGKAGAQRSSQPMSPSHWPANRFGALSRKMCCGTAQVASTSMRAGSATKRGTIRRCTPMALCVVAATPEAAGEPMLRQASR